MQRLWAPWRMAYILSEKEQGCFFCQKLRQVTDDERNFVLHRREHAFALLNIYPYNNGHILIAPYAHVGSLSELQREQITEVFEVTQLCERVLSNAVHPDGFNIGVNVGKAAGAGVEEHLHVHIVPRWNGDTNYMTTASNTRVIPQTLEDTYSALSPLFAQLSR
ncbi:HIT family hydrolase [candidate division KSB3 bacterium]|uniref:HIT family hydrolase n=1 Tax=candidate division KSB3 bacterium TaxID=2044937 RepID=A0A2G6K9H4_9BACT|nr:MAG: HIT family hydrolase [candidate division KSB3 bacterium]